MNTFRIERSQDVPILLIPNRREALDLLSTGFVVRYPELRLFFLEEEKQWLLAGQIWDAMERITYLNAGYSADYI